MCMNERGISNDNWYLKDGFCYAMLILFWHRPSTVNPGGQYLFWNESVYSWLHGFRGWVWYVIMLSSSFLIILVTHIPSDTMCQVYHQMCHTAVSQMTPSHVRLGCPMLPNEIIQYPIVWPFGSQTLHKTSREHGHSTCHSKAWNRFGLAWGTVSMFLMIGELCMSWGKSQCRRSPAKKLERHCLAPKLGGKIATDCNWQLGSWLRKSRGFEDLHNTSRSFHNPNRLRTN